MGTDHGGGGLDIIRELSLFTMNSSGYYSSLNYLLPRFFL